jgi:hypothetical protein
MTACRCNRNHVTGGEEGISKAMRGQRQARLERLLPTRYRRFRNCGGIDAGERGEGAGVKRGPCDLNGGERFL